MAHEEKFIEHLSSEIAEHTRFLSTFRSRMAFTILIGPFVFLGSVLFATRGTFAIGSIGAGPIAAIVIACLCYVSLAAYGAMLDNQVTRQCNIWRRQIDLVRKGNQEKIADIGFEYKPFTAYLIGLGLVLFGFLSIVYLLITLL